MADIHTVNQRYRMALRNREAAAVNRLTAAYSQAWQTLEEQIDLLAEQVAAQGDEISKSKLYTLERYRRVQDDLERTMGTLEGVVEKQITTDQAAAARLGSQSALDQIRAAFGDDAAEVLQSIELARIPSGQLENLVGFLADGSPLKAALNDLGPNAAHGLEDALISGMARGVSPREIARMARDAFGGNLSSALRYSRTATQYASRSAAIAHYDANSDVVRGWRWAAALDARTCLACASLHGRIFPLSEPMRSHWQCRCSASPVVRDTRVEWETGVDWFQRQPADVKEQMLGKAGYMAYKRGDADLTDFLGTRDDKTLGKVFQVRSLKSIVGAKQSRLFLQLAMAAD